MDEEKEEGGKTIYDVIILGLGPAGVTAGIYATRYGMKTLIIGKDYGTAGGAPRVDNYPGFLGITGLELEEKFVEHVSKLGAEVVFDEVVDVKRMEGPGSETVKQKPIFTVRTVSGEYFSKTLIICLGGKRKTLDIPGEKEYIGKGVSYCATCDAPLYKDKTVCVIGGSDAAVVSATLLAKFAKKVIISYRRDKLRAKEALVEELMRMNNVEVVYNSQPIEMFGDGKKLTGVKLNVNGKAVDYEVDGVFVEIGYVPNTEVVYGLNSSGVSLATDEKGYIIVDERMRTSIPGVFAAGDITTSSLRLQQIITACADGALAAKSAYEYLKENQQ